jgi:diguanylate cyclase (GGDEF)-like protein
MPSHALKETVTAQIRRFSGLEFQWLTFPAPLEARFEADTSARRCARLWLEGIIAIALFNLFLVVDHLGTSAQFWRAVEIRAGIITPLALAVNVSMLLRPPKVFREASIAFVASLAGLTHLYLESNKGPVASAYAQFGILAVILFANTSMRLRFPYALATSATMLLGNVVFLRLDTHLQRDQKLTGLCLTLATTAVTVVANYSFNREERLNYLLHLRDNVIVDDLNRYNEQLALIAQRDALTGLANRHAFDQKFQEYWREAFIHASALSVILIDLDNFKQMNDTYGHLYGDEVLKRIAHLLLEGLRVKGDFAARFGGEEFVILLPSTSTPAAIQVAERIRKLVEVAGLPPIEAPRVPLREGIATISCGVATARPITLDGEQSLLSRADRALYEAKAHGRNRVRCAAQESATA